jgi:hypothetical protein
VPGELDAAGGAASKNSPGGELALELLSKEALTEELASQFPGAIGEELLKPPPYSISGPGLGKTGS